MALELIAVQGMTFKFVNPAHSGVVTVTGAPSIKVKAGSGVYKDKLTIAISAGTDGTVVNATGSGNIPATAAKTKADGSLVLRKGDQSIDILMAGTIPGSGPGSYTTKVEILDPGQTKAKAA